MSAEATLAAPSSPYKGLAAFDDTELDALLFFGRTRETQVVAANVLASRLTLLYGPSGVGKSSLLRAGVVRALRGEGGFPPPAVAVYGSWAGDPLAGLEEAARAAVGDALEREPTDAPGGLADRLAAWSAELGAELCLLLDQLEELFLYHPSAEGAGGFLDLLPELVTRPGLRVNVLLGIRDDALAQLDVLKGRIPSLFANSLRLDHLDREAGREAILGPLERYNAMAVTGAAVAIEPELVEAVLDGVASGRIEPGIAGGGATENGGDSVARVETPYLQLVLQRVWDVEHERGSTTLRVATFRELGGAQRIVEDHLERALQALTPAQQDVAASVFGHLVAPSGTKIAYGVSDLASYAAVRERELEPVLRTLSHERILRPLGENGHAGGRFEIFHDVLAEAVLDWSARHEAEAALLRERAAAHRRQRRLLALAIGALIALALVTMVAVYAVSQRGEARAQARAAEARAFAAGAWAQLDTDPELSLLLALEAARREPSADLEDALRRALEQSQLRDVRRLPTPAAAVGRDHLRAAGGGTTVEAKGTEALLRVRGRLSRRLPHDVPIRALDLDRLGRVVTAAGKTAFVWAPRGQGRRVRQLEGHVGGILDVRFSPDGARIATASTDGTARLWDARSGELVAPVFGHQNLVSEVAFSPDGTMVATASDDGTARLWEAGTGRPLATLAGHRGPVTSVRFVDEGSAVVTTGVDGTLRRWNAFAEPRLVRTSAEPIPPATQATSSRGRVAIAQGRLVRLSGGESADAVLQGHDDDVTSVAFSPDGDLVVTASRDHDARIWDASTGRTIHVLRRHFGPVAAASFSPDGRWVVTAGPISAGLWEVATGRFVYYLRGHSAPLTAASIEPDGTIVTADRAGSTRSYRCETCGDLDALITLAERRLAATGRELAPAEQARYRP